MYSFSDEIAHEWNWTRRYPGQPEIEGYLNFVADKLGLREDIRLNVRITSARFDEVDARWTITTDDGDVVTCKYFIPAVGALTVTNMPDISGVDSFMGQQYHTARWPRADVDFRGKRVGVIGTGSTGVQIIPEIAKEAAHLTIFQRTPQYVVPANDYHYTEESLEMAKMTHKSRRQYLEGTTGGLPVVMTGKSVLQDDPDERRGVLEAAWLSGGFAMSLTYADTVLNEEANGKVSDFVRSKIKDLVKNPEDAEAAMPDYFFGAKRLVHSDSYYLTLNRSNVSLVDLRKSPIQEVTPEGIRTLSGLHDLDIIVYATGFDAITGACWVLRLQDATTCRWKRNGRMAATSTRTWE